MGSGWVMREEVWLVCVVSVGNGELTVQWAHIIWNTSNCLVTGLDLC
jgi:hypothetical protein